MQLTILGSGTVSWQTQRACSAYHVAAGDTHLLLDCGSGAMKRFEDAGIDYFDLDAVLLSHTEHPDHVTDLCMLLFSLNYTTQGPEYRVRTKPLILVGPQGTEEFYHCLGRVHEAITPRHYALAIRESSGGRLKVGDVGVLAGEVDHGDTPALGYRIEHAGKVLSFSGDTGPCERVIELFDHADVGLIECSLEADVVDVPNHLDARQVGRIAAQAAVQRLVVTHLYPGVRPQVVEQQVRESYTGQLFFARDLDRYDI